MGRIHDDVGHSERVNGGNFEILGVDGLQMSGDGCGSSAHRSPTLAHLNYCPQRQPPHCDRPPKSRSISSGVMKRPLRSIATALLCLASLVSNALGFTSGMVICTDADGCVAVEAAHVAHRGCHSDDEADLDHHDEAPREDHEDQSCVDVSLDTQRPEPVTAGVEALRLAGAHSIDLTHSVIARATDCPVTPCRTSSVTFEVGALRADFTGLRSIILLV